MIDPQRITLCEADQKYIRIHYNGREILTESSLKKLEQEYPQTFVRVHRNALVGLQHIEGLERSPDGETRVRITGLEQKPLVSRRHLKEVKERVATL